MQDLHPDFEGHQTVDSCCTLDLCPCTHCTTRDPAAEQRCIVNDERLEWRLQELFARIVSKPCRGDKYPKSGEPLGVIARELQRSTSCMLEAIATSLSGSNSRRVRSLIIIALGIQTWRRQEPRTWRLDVSDKALSGHRQPDLRSSTINAAIHLSLGILWRV